MPEATWGYRVGGTQREPWPNLVTYHLFKWLFVSPVLHGLYRGRIYGAENVPRSQALIVVSNHASNFDPPIVSNCVERPVAFMAKAELFKVPILKQAIQLYGAYPVHRGRLDRAALDRATERLNNHWAIGIFLSGSRSSDGRIHHAHQGAALLSAYTQTPLLPVALWGTEKIQPSGQKYPRMGCPVSVRIGKPIAPAVGSDRETLALTTAACVEAIHALLDEGR